MIEALRQAPALLKEAVQGLNDQQLDTPYRKGGGRFARSSPTWPTAI
ncbi:hypothetical protein QKW52_03025 [Bacillus sonorensis]|nr:hypothetical protein [Bacillus sonorensis]